MDRFGIDVLLPFEDRQHSCETLRARPRQPFGHRTAPLASTLAAGSRASSVDSQLELPAHPQRRNSGFKATG
jgi:hypothetical protein